MSFHHKWKVLRWYIQKCSLLDNNRSKSPLCGAGKLSLFQLPSTHTLSFFGHRLFVWMPCHNWKLKLFCPDYGRQLTGCRTHKSVCRSWTWTCTTWCWLTSVYLLFGDTCLIKPDSSAWASSLVWIQDYPHLEKCIYFYLFGTICCMWCFVMIFNWCEHVPAI